MSSQFIYLKSSKYLKDNDGGSILVNNSSLPYQFINSFREPIRVNPKSQIEIVSADLNVEPLHDISPINDNDAFTYAFGSIAEEFRQKLVKIPSGVYSNDELAEKINSIIYDTNNLDGLDIHVAYDIANGFEIRFLNFSNLNEDKNEYTILSSKQGYQQTDAEKNTGIGSYDSTIHLRNKNYLKHPNLVVSNNQVPVFTSTTLSNTTKPTNLCSNVIVPTERGIDASNGTTSMVLRPIQQCVYSSTFLSGATGKTFKIEDANTYTGLSLASYTGSNSYDFQISLGGTIHYFAFVKTKAFWDTLTLPNSLSTGNLPWGHFLIVNTTDTAINTTLASNTYSLMLDTNLTGTPENDYRWKLFSTTTGNSQFTFSNEGTDSYINNKGVRTSLGNWGSAVLGLSRGECAIVGTNQVNNTNRFTRARINNNDGDTQNDVRKRVLMDYSVLISPNKTGTDNIVKVISGTQDASKVAGQEDWIDNNTIRTFNLKTELPDITDNDNIIITCSMNAWYCLDFIMGHDNGGNMVFPEGDTSIIATTNQESSFSLPMNFNEDSMPIMPVFCPSNGYVKNNQTAMIFGNYSDKLISTHSLAKLNAYMNSTWGSNQTIPTRQSKALYTDYCRDFNLVDRDVKIQCQGFSNVNATTDYTIIDGDVQFAYPIEDNSMMMKLGMPLQDEDTSRVVAAGFSKEPPKEVIADRTPFINKLNLHMGMPNVLIIDKDVEDNNDEMKFQSENEIIYNESQNFIINLSNLGKIIGQNSNTNSVSAIAGIIPSAQLNEYGNSKHYKAQYPQPVSINAKTSELINNFEVNISNDDGTPATSLRHPINLTCRLTEN